MSKLRKRTAALLLALVLLIASGCGGESSGGGGASSQDGGGSDAASQSAATSESEAAPASGVVSTPGEYVVLNGKTNPSVWFMENDVILADGRYTGVETVNVDGTSYTIPVVEVYNAYYDTSRAQFSEGQKFDYPFIKVVAEAIFGKNIEIRDPVAGQDLSEEEAMMDDYILGGWASDPSEVTNFMGLVVELEDQSNANFQKFMFSKYSGGICDAKGPFDSGIRRNIEFSADFEHFFLITRNENLESLKLAYYDKSFNKIWEREFQEITSAVYDYTETNLYFVVNNEFYIINLATGEDVFPPPM